MTRHVLPILRTGETAIIEGISAAESSAKRLADMGFVPGAHVEMVRPGRPCIVRIGGTFIGLGTGYQNSIRLDPS